MNVVSFNVPADRQPPGGPRASGRSLPAPCRLPWNILGASHSTGPQAHSVQGWGGDRPSREPGPPSLPSASGRRLLQSSLSLPGAPAPGTFGQLETEGWGLASPPGAVQPGVLLRPFRKSSTGF